MDSSAVNLKEKSIESAAVVAEPAVATASSLSPTPAEIKLPSQNSTSENAEIKATDSASNERHPASENAPQAPVGAPNSGEQQQFSGFRGRGGFRGRTRGRGYFDSRRGGGRGYDDRGPPRGPYPHRGPPFGHDMNMHGHPHGPPGFGPPPGAPVHGYGGYPPQSHYGPPPPHARPHPGYGAPSHPPHGYGPGPHYPPPHAPGYGQQYPPQHQRPPPPPPPPPSRSGSSSRPQAPPPPPPAPPGQAQTQPQQQQPPAQPPHSHAHAHPHAHPHSHGHPPHTPPHHHPQHHPHPHHQPPIYASPPPAHHGYPHPHPHPHAHPHAQPAPYPHPHAHPHAHHHPPPHARPPPGMGDPSIPSYFPQGGLFGAPPAQPPVAPLSPSPFPPLAAPSPPPGLSLSSPPRLPHSASALSSSPMPPAFDANAVGSPLSKTAAGDKSKSKGKSRLGPNSLLHKKRMLDKLQASQEAQRPSPLAGKITVSAAVVEDAPQPQPLPASQLYASAEEAASAFRAMLAELNPPVTFDAQWATVLPRMASDKRYAAVKTLSERKRLFEEYQEELAMAEEARRSAENSKHRADFGAMLHECPAVDKDTRYRELEQLLGADPRFSALADPREREDLFLEHVRALEEAFREELRQKSDAFAETLRAQSGLTAFSLWHELEPALASDPSCAALDRDERLRVFASLLKDLRAQDADNVRAHKAQLAAAFARMTQKLIGDGLVHAQSRWEDVRAVLASGADAGDATFVPFKQLLAAEHEDVVRQRKLKRAMRNQDRELTRAKERATRERERQRQRNKRKAKAKLEKALQQAEQAKAKAAAALDGKDSKQHADSKAKDQADTDSVMSDARTPSDNKDKDEGELKADGDGDGEMDAGDDDGSRKHKRKSKSQSKSRSRSRSASRSRSRSRSNSPEHEHDKGKHEDEEGEEEENARDDDAEREEREEQQREDLEDEKLAAASGEDDRAALAAVERLFEYLRGQLEQAVRGDREAVRQMLKGVVQANDTVQSLTNKLGGKLNAVRLEHRAPLLAEMIAAERQRAERAEFEHRLDAPRSQYGAKAADKDKDKKTATSNGQHVKGPAAAKADKSKAAEVEDGEILEEGEVSGDDGDEEESKQSAPPAPAPPVVGKAAAADAEEGEVQDGEDSAMDTSAETKDNGNGAAGHKRKQLDGVTAAQLGQAPPSSAQPPDPKRQRTAAESTPEKDALAIAALSALEDEDEVEDSAHNLAKFGSSRTKAKSRRKPAS